MNGSGRKPLAFFRFDFGRVIGLGHLRRCEALGAELAARGWDCWATWNGPAADEDLLRRLELHPSFPIFDQPSPFSPDAVVLDSYLLPYEDRETAKVRGAKLIGFRDAPAVDPSDLVVDINAGAEAAAYKAAGCDGRVLAGPDFFPVRPALLTDAPGARARDRSGKAKRLLICFGGTSAGHGMAARALGELAAAGSNLEVRVIVGDLSGLTPELSAALKDCPRATTVAGGAPLGPQFAWADLALSAGGVTKYELALFGVPALVTAVSGNQLSVGEKFGASGAARWLGRTADVPAGGLGRAVIELAADGKARAAMSAAGRKLVDGRGSARIADELVKLVEKKS
jgi:spore coat polysaccharide biosynthesis predicted glycosyltransferase SpsG